MRKENSTIDRYRIEKDKILEIAKNAVNMGYKTIVLQSGEDAFYSTDKMTEIIKAIKELDVALTLSIGERSFEVLIKHSGFKLLKKNYNTDISQLLKSSLHFW